MALMHVTMIALIASVFQLLEFRAGQTHGWQFSSVWLIQIC